MTTEIKDIKCEKCSTLYGARGLFATENIKKDTVIFVLEGTRVPEPTRTSIQIEKDHHIEHPKGAYMNHHCYPTTEIIVNPLGVTLVIAKKDINNADEITFDYETTEDALAEPFRCKCCGKLVNGKTKRS
tara:strand:+ start:467 stop:856 length:390 start_codon:yes stop_codon:yes gene_type:complete